MGLSSKIFGWQKALVDTRTSGYLSAFLHWRAPDRRNVHQARRRPSLLALLPFNVADINNVRTAREGQSGHILEGPVEIPGNRWVIRCTDPQGATFALIGKRRHHGIGCSNVLFCAGIRRAIRSIRRRKRGCRRYQKS